MTEGKAAGMPGGPGDHKPVAGHAPLSFPRQRASRDDAVFIQFPVLRRGLVGRVQDRLVEEPHGEWSGMSGE